jgi:hypothetical protein
MLSHRNDDGLAKYGPERLYSGLSPHIAGGTVCVILQAFADDSENEKFYIVAGLVAPLERWKVFDPDWFGILKTPPKIRLLSNI